MPERVVAVVITHQHADHQDAGLLQSITKQFPDAAVFTTDDTAPILATANTHVVHAGEHVTAGPFSLEFFGGEHAIIDQSIAPIHNLGVMVNEQLYYPGDSFALPNKPVAVLALPISAPWMKLSEALDFLRAVAPERAFPTHDAILSDNGKTVTDRVTDGAAQAAGIVYERLNEPLQIV